MRINNKMLVILSAGAAVAGLVGFFAFTEKGKKLTGKWKTKGRQMADEMMSKTGAQMDRKRELTSVNGE